MIPLRLILSGFLSYRQPVEIDFTTFELACISGQNGAGKSSLLDAITWVLFGQGRKHDDSLINSHPSVKAAQVTLVFAYEGNVYSIQRTLPRGKTTQLEFHIMQHNGEFSAALLPGGLEDATWKALTERTLRETQALVEKTLRLDYDTFINASFFLQGKADQFTQQRPGDRKRVLGSILGLEVWESYRQRAQERRRAIENEIAILEGNLREIDAELAEEPLRREHLQALIAELEGYSRARQAQESAVDQARAVANSLAEQRKWITAQADILAGARRRVDDLQERIQTRHAERNAWQLMLDRADEIETTYRAWQEARTLLEASEIVAGRFRQQEQLRQEPLEIINATRARLLQEQQMLLSQQEAASQQGTLLVEARRQLADAQAGLSRSQARQTELKKLESERETVRQQLAGAEAENPHLKEAMRELKERIDRLEQVVGAACPLCGQPLSAHDRQRLIEEITGQGKEMGDRYRLNQALLQTTREAQDTIMVQLAELGQVEADILGFIRQVEQLGARINAGEQAVSDWKSQGEPRLEEIAASLERETFEPEARARLAEIDRELVAIGYDPAQHDAARRQEQEGRASEAALRELEKVRAALAPLEREIADLQAQFDAAQVELDKQRASYDDAAASLAAAEAQAPDLKAAETQLFGLQEAENKARMEVGAARQRVDILDDYRLRRKKFEAQREEQARQVGLHKQLERAFGKDGVPALLIEQALPQIESRANALLGRLSGGNMSVRFVTQAQFKDKNREDMRETLEIQISDNAGTRDYELFSGGEAFRVNFAIRLALSEMLAQRAGARLQTLVIDEGFGSQDALGRERLVEAINLVRQDFAKILVITHIDELRDRFPARIEVEKTDSGSSARVV